MLKFFSTFVQFEEEKVKEWLEKAKQFIEEIERVIDKELVSQTIETYGVEEREKKDV